MIKTPLLQLTAETRRGLAGEPGSSEVGIAPVWPNVSPFLDVRGLFRNRSAGVFLLMLTEIP